MSQMGCSVVIDRQQLTLQECTDECATLLGYSSPSDLVGVQLLDLVAAHAIEKLDKLLRDPRGPSSTSCIITHKNGSEILVILAIVGESTEGQSHLLRLLFIPVEDHRDQVAQLTQQMARLSEQNHRLRSLTSLAAHDLRNRLQTILSNAELIDLYLSSDEQDKSRTRLRYIARASNSMTNLIEAMSKYIRFEVTDYPVELVDLDQLLDEIIVEVSQNDERPVSISKPQRLPQILCERYLVRELFVNLIGNSIQYSDKSKIEIEVGIQDDTAASPVYFVRDNSAGIEAGDLSKVFDACSRVDHLNLNSHGSGMGMTLVQQIVHRHHGEIWLESTPREGTTVSFTLSAS